MYEDFHVLALYSDHQFLISSHCAQSVRESTRARVTIHYIPSPMASIPHCRRTKEIYDRIKFPCTNFPSFCTLETFLYFNEVLTCIKTLGSTIKKKKKSLISRSGLYNILLINESKA